ncbi:hypothetical protein JHK87_055785 [Glycine soja]|nr:hypothetical protein JHK87_055785 [Glycine soja]
MQSGEDSRSLQTTDVMKMKLHLNQQIRVTSLKLDIIVSMCWDVECWRKASTYDFDIDHWHGINEPTDIYVLSLQEILPLNLGNILGAEDTHPIPKWENIIQVTLNRVRPEMPKIKSFSDPPSPSKFKPSDDVPDIKEEILLESDSDIGEEVHPFDEENNICDGTFMRETVNTNLLASDAADIANTEVRDQGKCRKILY